MKKLNFLMILCGLLFLNAQASEDSGTAASHWRWPSNTSFPAFTLFLLENGLKAYGTVHVGTAAHELGHAAVAIKLFKDPLNGNPLIKDYKIQFGNCGELVPKTEGFYFHNKVVPIHMVGLNPLSAIFHFHKPSPAQLSSRLQQVMNKNYKYVALAGPVAGTVMSYSILKLMNVMEAYQKETSLSGALEKGLRKPALSSSYDPAITFACFFNMWFNATPNCLLIPGSDGYRFLEYALGNQFQTLLPKLRPIGLTGFAGLTGYLIYKYREDNHD